VGRGDYRSDNFIAYKHKPIEFISALQNVKGSRLFDFTLSKHFIFPIRTWSQRGKLTSFPKVAQLVNNRLRTRTLVLVCWPLPECSSSSDALESWLERHYWVACILILACCYCCTLLESVRKGVWSVQIHLKKSLLDKNLIIQSIQAQGKFH